MKKLDNTTSYLMIRLMMLFAVLFQTIWYRATNSFNDESINFSYFLLSFTFLLTSVFVLFLERISNKTYFIITQLVYDVLFVTALLVNTKAAEALYSLFFFIVIIVSATWFKARGGLVAAIVSAVLYLLVMSWKNSGNSMTRAENFALFPTAMIAIALLTGQLVEELKKSNIKVKRLENISEEIVESLDSGLLITDDAGVVNKINRTTMELLGKTNPATLIGKKIEDLGVEISYFPGIQSIMALDQEKKILVNQIRLPDQQKMYILRDLTEILNLEDRLKKQEKLASIGRLTAGVAHEIRNPIASISGAAQIIGDDQVQLSDEEFKKIVGIIGRETERVDELVSKLLTLTKPGVRENTKIDLNSVIFELVESFQTRTDVRDSEIKIVHRIEEPIEIMGNVDQVKDMISNLIVNSIQSLLISSVQSKQIEIIASLNKKIAVLRIIDNGVGISRDDQKQIFTPFFTTKPSGTGLGLAQVHKIITEFDGSIEVKSEQGKGAEFLLKIPV